LLDRCKIAVYLAALFKRIDNQNLRLMDFFKSKMLSSKLFILSPLLLIVLPMLGQESMPSLNVNYTDDIIQLDGILDEADWETADYASDFWQFFPTDSAVAQHQTEVKMLYNESTLYVGIRAESTGSDYVVSSLRRDFGGGSNDNVSLIFDTFRDGNIAFFFGVTPYGVQREGLVSDGGNEFNNTWDIKWQAESQMYEDHYIVEIAIPFTSLKFEEGEDTWRFRPYRWNLQTNEQSTWVRVPQNQLLSNLAFMGEMKFEEPLGKSRTPLAIIPYVNALAQKDYELDSDNTNIKFGGDAKVAIGNGLNLDLTVNPDFSNAEVDAIFTNLTRFELFLPERRQFFIDNSDLFASYGSGRDATPFFSRRIGLARDKEGDLIENRIIGGARLSGKLNENWRLGVLNIQTDEDIENEIPSNNNAMVALQRKVFARSNMGVFMVNRQTFEDYEFLEEGDRFNRVIGVDYNMASEDNTWSGKYYLHKSFQPGDNTGNFSSQAYTAYNSRKWRLVTDFVYVGEEFTADLGFVPRKDIFKTGQSISRNFYPQQTGISMHSFRFLALNFWRPNLDFKNTDHLYELSWEAAFKDQSEVEVSLGNNYIFLTRAFDPTRTEGGVPIPGDKGYYFNQFSVQYQSSPTNLLTFAGESSVGQFFNGQSYSVGGELALRFQPWAQISVALNYDGIRLPDPHPDADLWLLSPRVEVTFNKSLFWSTIFQYSNQRDNFGINSRLQWRFAPLSDLFLVYNDNYFTSHFSPRFRSINLKFVYWLNI